MSPELDAAVYALLTPTRGVIDRHRNDGRHRCSCCGGPWPCFDPDTAIGALDLVLRVHAAARHQPDATPGPPSSARERPAAGTGVRPRRL